MITFNQFFRPRAKLFYYSFRIIFNSDSIYSVAVEVADLIVVGYIVEAGHIADIEEMKHIAEGMHQEKMIDIAVEERDFVGLVQPAGEES